MDFEQLSSTSKLKLLQATLTSGTNLAQEMASLAKGGINHRSKNREARKSAYDRKKFQNDNFNLGSSTDSYSKLKNSKHCRNVSAIQRGTERPLTTSTAAAISGTGSDKLLSS